MIALLRSVGEDYTNVVERTHGDHDLLPELERGVVRVRSRGKSAARAA